MRTALIMLILSFSGLMHGQNIVPNWSFEDSVNCPSASSQITNAKGWTGYGTPDYFKSCATNANFSVPNNWGGYQPAATGNAYCAFGTSMAYITNGREFIRRSLPSPLTIGTKYFVSLKVNLSISKTIAVNCATNNLGIAFSTAPLNAVNNNPQVYTTQVVTDTTNWTIISGSFVADSAYTYLNIGNFFDDMSSTRQSLTSDTTCNSYYYVDDICVSTDSLYCPKNPETGNKELTVLKNYQLYPNPTDNYVNLLFENRRKINHTLSIYDMQGRLMRTINNITTGKLTLDVTDFTSGLYFIQLQSRNTVRFTTILSVE